MAVDLRAYHPETGTSFGRRFGTSSLPVSVPVQSSYLDRFATSWDRDFLKNKMF
jgi:hypothetical protein